MDLSGLCMIKKTVYDFFIQYSSEVARIPNKKTVTDNQ